MKFSIGMAAVLAVATAAAMAQTAQPSLPPIEAFGTLPVVASPALSADGKKLSLIQTLNGVRVVTSRDVDALGARPIAFPYQEGFIEAARWVNNKRLLVWVKRNEVYWRSAGAWYRLDAIDADGKNPTVMFSDKREYFDYNSSMATVAGFAQSDPDHVYMPLYTARYNLFRVDVNSGHSEQVMGGSSRTGEWVMDGNGTVVARLDETIAPLVDHIWAYTANKEWKEIAATSAAKGKGFGIYGLTIDGKSLVIWGISPESRTDGLNTMSLADGSVQPAAFNAKYDISSILKDPWTGRVIGVSLTTHLTKDSYFDAAIQTLHDAVQKSFPNLSVHLTSWDTARRRIVFSTVGPSSPAVYYLLDLTTKAVSRLGNSYPDLKSENLGTVQPYDYKARDGLEIPAYLTLPPGKQAKNLPVVIMPHGGPQARDDMSFDWESQFLATRGYAVLRPNYRGSYGYGRKFQEAGYGQWGLKMQDDVTDGVKKLIADGIADPKRICIVGGSYGGYAALAGAAFTPDLYACAAAWAPVTDLRRMLIDEDEGPEDWSAFVSAEKLYIGDHWSDSTRLDGTSPALHADAIKCPVLLMHGEHDTTVPIDQSKRMDYALRRADKKVTFIEIRGETHHMEMSATRIRWLTELEKFLKENIGN